MFQPRKGKVAINPGGSPEFQIQYIGCTETYVANGMGCTTPHVQKLWDSCPEERFLKRALLIINAGGIQVKFIENRKIADLKVDIKDISYCCAQQDIHERVFSWICKSGTTSKKLLCHAVLCSSKEKAQTISLVLSRAFHIAYREWKLEKERKERNSKQTMILGGSNKQQQQNPSIKIQSNEINKSENHKNGGTESTTSPNQTSIQPADGNHYFLDDDLHSQTYNLENGSISKAVISKIINGNMDKTSDDNSSSASGSLDGNISDAQMNAAMAQMNIVEEDEVSFTDNNLAFEPDANDEREVYSEHL